MRCKYRAMQCRGTVCLLESHPKLYRKILQDEDKMCFITKENILWDATALRKVINLKLKVTCSKDQHHISPKTPNDTTENITFKWSCSADVSIWQMGRKTCSCVPLHSTSTLYTIGLHTALGYWTRVHAVEDVFVKASSILTIATSTRSNVVTTNDALDTHKISHNHYTCSGRDATTW